MCGHHLLLWLHDHLLSGVLRLLHYALLLMNVLHDWLRACDRLLLGRLVVGGDGLSVYYLHLHLLGLLGLLVLLLVLMLLVPLLRVHKSFCRVANPAIASLRIPTKTL
mmetsp:Transcript_70792/g.147477  ORF Transcript_70792/g.147477 Transcript_70792/m.147477 type:complete len:108 (-) Transcript_70792:162-485(-)